MASTDLSAFSLFIRQNFITINLQPASIPPFKCSSLPRRPLSSHQFQQQHRLNIQSYPNFTVYLKETDNLENII